MSSYTLTWSTNTRSPRQWGETHKTEQPNSACTGTGSSWISFLTAPYRTQIHETRLWLGIPIYDLQNSEARPTKPNDDPIVHAPELARHGSAFNGSIPNPNPQVRLEQGLAIVTRRIRRRIGLARSHLITHPQVAREVKRNVQGTIRITRKKEKVGIILVLASHKTHKKDQSSVQIVTVVFRLIHQRRNKRIFGVSDISLRSPNR